MEQISNLIRSTERLQVDEKTTESTLLAKEIYNHFGKGSGRRIYPLFSNPRYTHRQIKDAWKAYQQSDIRGLKFFMWTLNHIR